MDEKLMLCPFCGKQPILIDRGFRDGFDIRCHCKAQMNDCGSKEVAIKEWNTRIEGEI